MVRMGGYGKTQCSTGEWDMRRERKRDICKIGDVQIWRGQVPVQTGMNAVCS